MFFSDKSRGRRSRKRGDAHGGRVFGKKKLVQKALQELQSVPETAQVRTSVLSSGFEIRFDLEIPRDQFTCVTESYTIRFRYRQGAMRIASETSRQAEVLIPNNGAPWHRIGGYLRSFVRRRANGIKTEIRIESLIGSLIQDRRMTPNGVTVSQIFGTGQKDDAKYGIDLRLVCIKNHRFFVPLQIKSDTRDQGRHKKKYAAVPSIVVRWNEENESIVKKIDRLIDAYAAGEVVHV